jgi:hypothetical protein
VIYWRNCSTGTDYPTDFWIWEGVSGIISIRPPPGPAEEPAIFFFGGSAILCQGSFQNKEIACIYSNEGFHECKSNVHFYKSYNN